MKSNIYILLCLLMVQGIGVFGQVIQPPVLQKSEGITDTLSVLQIDTIPNGVDSLVNTLDTIIENYVSDQIKLSPDAVTDEVDYGSLDSNWTSVAEKEVHLYGNAYINYQDMKINADYIKFSFGDNTVFAYALKNDQGKYGKLPDFQMGDTKANFLEMKYNFKSKKAFVKSVQMVEGEFHIRGSEGKFISEELDTIDNEAKIYNRSVMLSTCNHDPPHFGIVTSKLKFIPDKLAIFGPSQMQIHGIPTPLVLPFGFFPLIQGQSSGLIFPKSYDYNAEQGFGLRDIGYYFPLSDYVDLRLTSDIYTRGSYMLKGATNYKKRYAYSGVVDLQFGNIKVENQEGVPLNQRSFSFKVNHIQDPKAHPYRRLGGTINITTNRHDQRNYNDASSVLTNRLTSNFSYDYAWPESPFKFSMGLAHAQNNSTRAVEVTLPNARLSMNTIQPFKRKNAIGEPRWYESINLDYGADFRNYVAATDTTLFTQQTLKNLQTGFNHSANLSSNFRLFKYINVSPAVNYQEIYFFRYLEKTLDPNPQLDTIPIGVDIVGDTIFEIDTIRYGTVVDELKNGLRPYRRANISLSANTQRFFTRRFSKGFIRGIRHVTKPGVSFNYSPSTQDRYSQMVPTDPREEFNTPLIYSPFPTGVFSAPLSGEQASLTWSMTHIFESKYWSKKDTTEKLLKIFETINMSGGYNFAADSLNWNPIMIGGTTRLVKGLSTLTFSSSFSPYIIENNRMVNKFHIHENNKLLDLTSFNLGFNTSLSFKQIRDIFSGKNMNEKQKGSSDPQNNRSRQPQATRPVGGPMSLGSLLDNFRITHNLAYGLAPLVNGQKDFRVLAHQLSIRGNLNLTENWNVSVDNFGYDFNTQTIVYPSFSFARTLHCWQMSFSWYPQRDVYSFFIGVSSGALNFLKYNYGQRNPGVLFGG